MSSTIVLKRSVATAASSAATSPNPKSVGKNKAAAAVKEPTPVQAAYGCSHIKLLLDSAMVSVRDSYVSAIRLLADQNRLDAQTCTKCNEVLTRTMLCLQCSNVACQKEAEAHSKATRHMFGIDSKSASMYCFLCQDFIYDPFIEKTRVTKQAELMEGNIRKKRKLEEKSSPDDLKYIETNTTSAPCRATGLRGFYNMGATCFISVVLQSLIHNPIMRNFYLSDGHRAKECAQVNCMSCAVEEVFAEFFTSDKVEGFGPTNLLITSWKCDQALAGCKQQDAHEYLQFLLNQLHTTNGGVTDNTKTGSCKCIIHRCFYGKLQSDVTCGNCHNVTTALDPVMDLSLELKPKPKGKRGHQTNGDDFGSATTPEVLTLQECLERFTTPEKLGIEYNCVKCSGSTLQEATKQLTVKRLPPVLCIQLKRFEHSSSGFSKIDTKVRFPAQLDMTPYITRSKRKPTDLSIPAQIPIPTGNSKKEKAAAAAALASNAAAAAAAAAASAAILSPPPSNFQYELLTVVVHDGQIDTGHYYSYSKSNGQWFKFNDSVVSAATEAQVLAEKAYLLFYIVRSLSTLT
ncbi:hypothetical protein DFH27DRAFT_146876 [Peziza echinospora]|nr:hypothetical protein DFH27DRAFT_146876 [Peziza echinospora]